MSAKYHSNVIVKKIKFILCFRIFLGLLKPNCEKTREKLLLPENINIIVRGSNEFDKERLLKKSGPDSITCGKTSSGEENFSENEGDLDSLESSDEYDDSSTSSEDSIRYSSNSTPQMTIFYERSRINQTVSYGDSIHLQTHFNTVHDDETLGKETFENGKSSENPQPSLNSVSGSQKDRLYGRKDKFNSKFDWIIREDIPNRKVTFSDEEDTDSSNDPYDSKYLSCSSKDNTGDHSCDMPEESVIYTRSEKKQPVATDTSLPLQYGLNALQNEETLRAKKVENVFYSPQQMPNGVSKSKIKDSHGTKALNMRIDSHTILDEEGHSHWKSFLENDSHVVTDPYRLLVIEIDVAEKDRVSGFL